MLRFAPRAPRPLVTSRRAEQRVVQVLAAALLAVLLAGCNSTSPANPSFEFTPTPNRPSPQRAEPTGPVTAPSSETRAARPGLRPMTAWEKQYRDQCRDGLVETGCHLYTDLSLRLQGVDPET